MSIPLQKRLDDPSNYVWGKKSTLLSVLVMIIGQINCKIWAHRTSAKNPISCIPTPYVSLQLLRAQKRKFAYQRIALTWNIKRLLPHCQQTTAEISLKKFQTFNPDFRHNLPTYLLLSSVWSTCDCDAAGDDAAYNAGINKERRDNKWLSGLLPVVWWSWMLCQKKCCHQSVWSGSCV